MSIRRRFILVFSVFSIAMATAFGWISYGIARNSLEGQLDQLLTNTAGAAAEASGITRSLLLALEPGDESFVDWVGITARLANLKRSQYVDGAWIFNASDRSAYMTHLGDSIPIGTRLTIFDPYEVEIEEAMRDGSSTSSLFPGIDQQLYKYGFKRFDQSEAILAVRMPAQFLEPLSRLRNLLLIGTLLGVILAIWLGAALAAGVARPLERLSRAALRIQRGHLEHPVRLDRSDELGRLAEAMERMRGGIVQRDEQLRLMLAQVAHEIRNPLGGLELFASAASEEEDAQERIRIMSRIRDEVSSLNRIIEEFLTFARPGSVELESVDVRQPIEAAIFLSGNGRSQVEVELPDTPLVARVDPDQIKRVVLNLIRNALQIAENVVVSATVENGEIVISVADDGPGVPEELRERIFEPFVTDKEQGAGLGLAIVRRVAEAHGGRVVVVPEPSAAFGKGATFRVYLPGLEDFIPDGSNDSLIS